MKQIVFGIAAAALVLLAADQAEAARGRAWRGSGHGYRPSRGYRPSQGYRPGQGRRSAPASLAQGDLQDRGEPPGGTYRPHRWGPRISDWARGRFRVPVPQPRPPIGPVDPGPR
jgi:hypothetical protein